MNDIAELESRLAAALDRIGVGLEGLAPPAPPPEPEPAPEPQGPSEETLALRRDLEAEREVTAQLEERVRAVRQAQDERVAEIEAALTALEAKMQPLQDERQRLKQVNAALRLSNEALRKANAAGLANADLVNTAMEAELDALRAVQSSDSAELAGIIAELAPIVSAAEGTNA